MHVRAVSHRMQLFYLLPFWEPIMDNNDERCCGSGTCIINSEGLCWCGQQWNGTAMCRPQVVPVVASNDSASDTVQHSEAP